MADEIRVLMIASDWPIPGPDATTYFIQRQADFLQAAGVAVEKFAFRGYKNPLRYLRNWARVRRRISRERFDLIHAQFGQSGLLALPRRLPLVVTFRGSDLLGIINDVTGRHTLPGRVSQQASRFVARHADAVVVVAEHMKQFLPRGVSATVIPSGLDLTLFQPVPQAEARRRLGLPQDRHIVVFAGRPSQARKRYGLAKQAVEVLTRLLPADLHVVWGVPHEEVPLHLSAGDALLFTSSQEGSPNVVKEALACNLPVVSVRVADVPERLRGVVGCELCDDERPETLAAALERVLRRRQRSNGREAAQALDERLLTARLIEVYRSVLRPRESGRAQQHQPRELAH
jgi:glycosyltransferase involved in cell wall biosynthesis